jgi:hypothetical protein
MNNIDRTQLNDIIRKTLAHIEEGMHSYLEIFDGEQFIVFEPEGDGTECYLSVWVTDKLDSLNYGNGEILFNAGTIDCSGDEDEIESVIDNLMDYMVECGNANDADEEDELVEEESLLEKKLNESCVTESKVKLNKFDMLFESVKEKFGAK